MKTNHTSVLAVVMLTTSSLMLAADSSSPPPQSMPPMPEATKEHAWLERFVGEWEGEAEITMAPDQPATTSKGTERIRQLGEFWIISEGTGQMPGMGSMAWLMTVGYDAEKRKYVATWIDSMTGTLWTYDGTVDASGRKLVLEAEGPCPGKPGVIAKFRDVNEFKSNDERVFTSSMQNEDGSWTTLVKGTYRRKK